MPGETSAIDVTLQTTKEVAEAWNTIVLGPEIRISVDDLGQPLCALNPEISEDGTFALLCDQADVCTLEALVFGLANVGPIPSGSIFYTCQITVALDSAPGTYSLICPTANANDPDGNAMSTACINGSVLVGAVPLPSPTPTKRPPPTATATARATVTRTATATRTSAPGQSVAHDGCQAAAPAGTHGLWLLALPAAFLCLRRRRMTRK
jgi:hypothetical protein